MIFDADVDAEGGAYATGVLVSDHASPLSPYAGCATRWQRKLTVALRLVALIFIYTTIANMHRTPGRRQDRLGFHRGYPHRVAWLYGSHRLIRAARDRGDASTRWRSSSFATAAPDYQVSANEPGSRDWVRSTATNFAR